MWLSAQGHEFELSANGVEAFAAGADDYITKPLNFQALLGKVARALAAPAA